MPAGLEPRFAPPADWTWGLVQPAGAPAARYGVAAPAGVPRADILILTSYGEPAEVWFETAGDLIARGYVVWVLEPVGQGGSGRYDMVRDLGDAPSLRPDVEAGRLMAEKVIRRRPLIVVASGTSAPAAILALASGASADGLVLSAPKLETASARTLSRVQQLERVGLDGLPADFRWRWGRNEPDDRAMGLTHDAARGRLRLLWQAGNPELRMGGPSWRWLGASSQAAADATGPAAARVQAPVLVLQPDGDSGAGAALCKRLPKCAYQPLGPVGGEPELEVDEPRKAWLSSIEAFTRQHLDDFSPPPPRARGL